MITNRIYEWARVQPGKPALIYNDSVFDYAYFAKSIEAARQSLEKYNLPQGATAIVLVSNFFDAWRVNIALRTLGLNTISISSLDQIPALQIKNVACIAVTDLGYRFYQLGERTLTGAKVIVVPRIQDSDVQMAGMPEYRDNNRPFGGHILYTSGTTSAYKKLKADGSTEDKRNLARARAYSINKDTIYRCTFGMWTQVGFRTPSAVWTAGGCVAFSQQTGEGPEKTNSLGFFRHAVNFSIIIPSVLGELVQSADPSNGRHDDCRLVVTAGFLPFALAEKAIHTLTNNVDVSYGSTELGTPALVSRFENMDSLYWLQPANERVIQVVDENGNQCSAGQQGELRILIEDTDCNSYLDDEQATAKMFRDGFFYPGDMAIKRADGRIRILGRVSDVINVQGAKVAVGPIEESICRFLNADEVCLFTHLNDAGQDELIIAMQSDRKPPPDKLDQIARKYPYFESFRFAIFRELPRTDTGTRKVRRAALKARILAESINALPLSEPPIDCQFELIQKLPVMQTGSGHTREIPE